MVHLGLSARMNELNAAVGLLSLRNIDALVSARRRRISQYRERVGTLPGCWIQEYPRDRMTSGNYFVLFITNRARRSRDEVYLELKAAGIQTKRYFYPAVHTQTIFQRFPMRVSARMTQTMKISQEGLALPLYSHMTDEQIERVCGCVAELLG
jgi:dTDP-4-amino-4,6-dideoxygalactose transaminase